MTFCTPALSREKCLPLFRVAGENISHSVGLPESCVGDALVEERGDIGNLLRRQVELGHTLILTAGLQQRADVLSAFVI